jgi:hypothetical protein
MKKRLTKTKRPVKKKSKRWHQVTNSKKIWQLANRITALEKRVFSPPDAWTDVKIVE